MELYIMGAAGGTKKHLVIIFEGAYEHMTLQQIGNLICDSCQVTMGQVNVDLQDVEEIDIVDSIGFVERLYVEENYIPIEAAKFESITYVADPIDEYKIINGGEE